MCLLTIFRVTCFYETNLKRLGQEIGGISKEVFIDYAAANGGIKRG